MCKSSWYLLGMLSRGMLLFPILLMVHPAFAQSPEAQLAHSSEIRSDQHSCDYAEFLKSYLTTLSDDEVKTALRNQHDAYERALLSRSEPMTGNEMKLHRQLERDYRIFLEAKEHHGFLQTALSAMCTGGRKAGGVAVKATALAGSGITSAITAPIRFFAKFILGTTTRLPQEKRGPSYSDLIGGKASQNWIGVGYQGARVLLWAGSQSLFALYGVTAIDMQAQEFCRSNEPKTKRQQQFCTDYLSLKNTEYRVTQVGAETGKEFRSVLLGVTDFRQDEAVDQDLCAHDFKKQLRVAKRARERLQTRLHKSGMVDAEVLIMPPAPKGCVAIRITELEPAQKILIDRTWSGVADGIAYTTETKEVKPEPGETGATPVRTATPEPTVTPVPSPTPDWSKDEDVCNAVYSSKELDFISKGANLQMKADLIQTLVNPARFAKPIEEELITVSSKLVSEPPSDLGFGRNVILVMAPSPDQEARYEAELNHQYELEAELKAEDQKLKWLKKAKTVDACIERQEATKFNYQKYMDLENELQNLAVVQRIQDFRAMMKQAKKAGRRLFGLKNSLKLDWEIVEMTDLNVLHDLLRDPKLLNLIIVTHGEETGKIVDSNLNEIPTNAFEAVRPNLQSISFFSCHSVSSSKTYRLKTLLAARESYHEVRAINHVLSSDFLEKYNQAPVVALKDFIEQVDRAAYRQLLGNSRVQMAFQGRMQAPKDEAMCTLQFQGLEVTRGTFSVKLNGHWAGMVNQTNENDTLSVPCDWAKTSPLKVVIENPNLVKASKPWVKSDRVTITITGSGDPVVLGSPAAKSDEGKIVRLTWEQGVINHWEDLPVEDELQFK